MRLSKARLALALALTSGALAGGAGCEKERKRPSEDLEERPSRRDPSGSSEAGSSASPPARTSGWEAALREFSKANPDQRVTVTSRAARWVRCLGPRSGTPLETKGELVAALVDAGFDTHSTARLVRISKPPDTPLPPDCEALEQQMTFRAGDLKLGGVRDGTAGPPAPDEGELAAVRGVHRLGPDLYELDPETWQFIQGHLDGVLKDRLPIRLRRLPPLHPDSLVTALGLLERDEITVLNGSELRGAGMLDAVTALKKGSGPFALTIKRDGKPLTLEYRVRSR